MRSVVVVLPASMCAMIPMFLYFVRDTDRPSLIVAISSISRRAVLIDSSTSIFSAERVVVRVIGFPSMRKALFALKLAKSSPSTRRLVMISLNKNSSRIPRRLQEASQGFHSHCLLPSTFTAMSKCNVMYVMSLCQCPRRRPSVTPRIVQDPLQSDDAGLI